MPNHFHLVVETPQPTLVAGMKWLPGTYTGRFNRRHRQFGHLFSGRYKALLVDGSRNGYLKTVCDYVHLNPALSRLLKAAQPLERFRWSSYLTWLLHRHAHRSKYDNTVNPFPVFDLSQLGGIFQIAKFCRLGQP
jgi:hypothetical protein